MCKGTNVVPCGRSDMPGIDTVKLFCPNCNDVYAPPSSRFQGIDGSSITMLHPVRATDFRHVKVHSSAPPSRICSFKATASLRQLRSTDHIPPRAHQALLTRLPALLASLRPLSTRTLTEVKSALQAKSTCPRSMALRSANEQRLGRGCSGCV